MRSPENSVRQQHGFVVCGSKWDALVSSNGTNLHQHSNSSQRSQLQQHSVIWMTGMPYLQPQQPRKRQCMAAAQGHCAFQPLHNKKHRVMCHRVSQKVTGL